jgi:hypothetical protein
MTMMENSNRQRFYVALTLVVRILVGATFLFSGFVKAVDPLGTAFKLNDYFVAFGMEAFKGTGIYLSMALLSLEMTIGISLIFNIWHKFNVWVLTFITVYFTGLTLFIALTNPVSDCGCFGDAIKISNWATFYKNILLLGLTFVLLLSKNRFNTRLISIQTQKVMWFIFIIFSLAIALYSLRSLPPIDFRPYKVGTNLIEARKIPADAEPDQYKNFFYYEKNGNIKKFDEDNYPWQDSTWHFLEMETELVKKGYDSPYNNLVFFDSNQNDVTESILNNAEYTWLLVSYDLSAIPLSMYDKIHAFLIEAESKNIRFNLVTSAGDSDIKTFEYRSGVGLPVITADEILLKTIIRANPGIVVLHKGIIVGKWNFNSFNTEDVTLIQKPLESGLSEKAALKTRLIILNLAAILLLIFLVAMGIERIKNKYF